MESSGKHAGKRRAEPGHQPSHQPSHQGGHQPGHHASPDMAEASTRSRTPLLLLALGVTLSVVAWGYLVYAAIDFGANARAGDTNSWWLLGLASTGAVACLFVGLLLVARLLRMLGVLKTEAPKPPRPVGGKRAAR